jgi:hypothetical protein
MAELGEFNAEEHGEMQSFEPVPPGKYEAMVVDSELKPTKAGDLNQLKLSWQITSGDCAGRLVWSRVNLPNRAYPMDSLGENKRKAIEIGGKELAAICRAVGKPRITDSAELHNLPIVVDVRIKPAENGYPASNEIKGYAPIGEAVAAAAAPATPRTPVNAAPAKAAGSPPWARK